MAIPAERKMKKAMNGHPLTIRSRIPTGIHAATISVAQIEFAASKIRQEITKLDENEAPGILQAQIIRFTILIADSIIPKTEGNCLRITVSLRRDR
jgi:hypothetical protein